MRADRVTLRTPADGAYVAVLRTATAGLAARSDFTLDEIEDLRIAVDEACALLLQRARQGAMFDCTFDVGTGDLAIRVAVDSDDPRPPRVDTFAWAVLTALAGKVEASATDQQVEIRLHKTRGAV
jgi:serine/threonine-protein kinase RsbW